MDDFTRQYIATALWASMDLDTDDPLDENFDGKPGEFGAETLQQIKNDCQAFQERAGEMIAGRESDAGHDFWLTRNGHGAGFWDGDWPHYGEELTEISKTFGECCLYASDGKLYVA